MEKVIVKKADGYDGGGLDSAVECILAENGLDALIKKGSRVVLKVNLLRAAKPEEAITTHPAVIAAVIKSLQARGAAEIIIADSPSGPFSASRIDKIYSECGLTALEKGNVSLNRDLASSTRSLDRPSARRFNVLDAVSGADVIINIGKLKSHAMMGMTMAAKNMFGVIPGLEKSEEHCAFPETGNFADMLCELCELVKPDISLLDAVVGMEGDGPAAGSPRKLGFVIGGKDPFLVDRAAIELLGVKPKQAATVSASIERGLAPADFGEIPLAGDVELFDAPLSDFALPATDGDGVGETFGAALQKLMKGFAPRPAVNREKCVGCGRCFEICPQKTIKLKNKKARIVKSGCIRCFCCHEACPERAIDIKKNLFFRLVR